MAQPALTSDMRQASKRKPDSLSTLQLAAAMKLIETGLTCIETLQLASQHTSEATRNPLYLELAGRYISKLERFAVDWHTSLKTQQLTT
ncbi:MAG: hypothetical protein ACU84Q_21160 [Gammaproteobacteria bacterium]